jgi:hypothetical protein
MAAYQHKKDVKAMYQDISQQLRSAIERMLRRGTLSKIEVMAINVHMTRDEFNSKVSYNPRTILTNGERFAIESEIATLDPETYSEYLQTLHPNLGYIKQFIGDV